MSRWAAIGLGAWLGLLAGQRLEAGPSGVHVTGILGGPDTEGGYFELIAENGVRGREVIVATPINSAIYPHLKALVGHPVQVSVFLVGK